jgi:hypothetical protein
MQLKAISLVQRAIRRGEMPPAKALICVDCGKPALEYDHRDYSKPLEVEPVCSSCNHFRGPAIQLQPLSRHRKCDPEPQRC